MKYLKLALLLISVFYLFGCESSINKGEQFGIDTETKEMTIAEASIEAVLSFVEEVYPQKYKTLSLTKEGLKLEFVTNVSFERNKFFTPSADNTSKEIDTLLSVINFGNDEGFAIVSTQDNQILAVTESGDLTIEDLTMDYSSEDFENNPKAVIANYVANYTSSLPTIPVGPIGPITPPVGPMEPIDTSINYGYVITGPWVTETQINPLVQIKLHQKDPYNRHCLNSNGEAISAGCVAIAVVHIMSANKYPNTIGDLTYDWNLIINQYQTNSIVQDVLAQWIRTVGGECDIKYLLDSTSSSITKAKNCLSLYPRYTNLNIITDPQYNDIYTMLQNKTPLYFRGLRTDSVGELKGHAWVVDGCIYQKRSVKFYDNNEVLTGEYYEDRDYVHCCWGWRNAKCDGYYFTNIFNLENGAKIPDEGTSGKEEKNYNISIKAITYNLN